MLRRMQWHCTLTYVALSSQPKATGTDNVTCTGRRQTLIHHLLPLRWLCAASNEL